MKYSKNFYQIKSNETIFESIKEEINSIGYYNLPLQDTTEIKEYSKTITKKYIANIGIGGNLMFNDECFTPRALPMGRIFNGKAA